MARSRPSSGPQPGQMRAGHGPGGGLSRSRSDDSRLEIIDLGASIRANTECIGECRDRRPAAGFTSASRPSICRLMNTTSHDFVTVDMRSLKGPLVARALALRVSVSALVRGAVARDLGLSVEGAASHLDASAGADSDAANVKLSIRMTPQEARQLIEGARAAGLSRGAYLAGLVAGVPVLSTGGGRAEHIAALVASSAELSTLSRNIHQLAALLRQANVEAARPYREMLDTLAVDVRRHLEFAARVLADLQPQRVPLDPRLITPSGDRRRFRWPNSPTSTEY